MKRVGIIFVLILVVGMIGLSSAQDDFAATMEVLQSGVDVQRVNTSDRIAVNLEAIVGVGDTIYTGDSGRVRIHFFDDGTSVTLEANTIYRIEEFRRNGDESFILRTSVLLGEAIQELARVLDENSAYIVETPGLNLHARGTVFAVRVESSRRSSTVVREGEVEAESADETETTSVRAGFGVRSEPNSKLSDVVNVNTFSQLDSYIDGCTVAMSTPDDVSLNVRLGPSLDAERISFVDAAAVSLALGTVEDTNWYRIQLADSFGWIFSSSATVQTDCAGLRLFTAEHQEDPTAYNPDAYELPLMVGDA